MKYLNLTFLGFVSIFRDSLGQTIGYFSPKDTFNAQKFYETIPSLRTENICNSEVSKFMPPTLYLPIVVTTASSSLSPLSKNISCPANSSAEYSRQELPLPAEYENCDETLRGPRGVGYQGCQIYTRSGKLCQRWDTQFPHNHKMPKYPHRYCRNVDYSETIWCYTSHITREREYCSSRAVFDPVNPGLVDPFRLRGGNRVIGCDESIRSGRYAGCQNRAGTLNCISWKLLSSKVADPEAKGFNLWDHAYCRNYGGQKSQPWCFTSESVDGQSSCFSLFQEKKIDYNTWDVGFAKPVLASGVKEETSMAAAVLNLDPLEDKCTVIKRKEMSDGNYVLWYMIDLVHEVEVDYITLYANRQGGLPITNFRVSLGNDSTEPVSLLSTPNRICVRTVDGNSIEEVGTNLGCRGRGRFLTFHFTAQTEEIQICKVQVWGRDDLYVNPAEYRPGFGSTTGALTRKGDLVNNFDMNPSKCYLSDEAMSPFWRTELSVLWKIGSVMVHLGSESVKHPHNGLSVYIVKDLHQWRQNKFDTQFLCGTIKVVDLPNRKVRIACTQALIGRYVIVTVPNIQTRINLCNVRVYPENALYSIAKTVKTEPNNVPFKKIFEYDMDKTDADCLVSHLPDVLHSTKIDVTVPLTPVMFRIESLKDSENYLENFKILLHDSTGNSHECVNENETAVGFSLGSSRMFYCEPPTKSDIKSIQIKQTVAGNFGFCGIELYQYPQVNPCFLGANQCHSKARCIPGVGDYKCECFEPFTGDGFISGTGCKLVDVVAVVAPKLGWELYAAGGGLVLLVSLASIGLLGLLKRNKPEEENYEEQWEYGEDENWAGEEDEYIDNPYSEQEYEGEDEAYAE